MSGNILLFLTSALLDEKDEQQDAEQEGKSSGDQPDDDGLSE